MATPEELKHEAELQVQALGAKPYPVLICSTCFGLTGWLGSERRCETCIDRARRHAAYGDSAGGWVSAPRESPSRAETAGVPAWKRAAAVLGWRRPQDEHLTAEWGRYVDPGETGPPMPEDGFELACAERTEGGAPEGSDLLVRFFVSTRCFEQGGWRPVTGRMRPDPQTPGVFPASLPIEQLAEAWGDFREEVAAFNRDAWRAEDERRETERQADEALAAARREQRGTSDLLD